jgi:hypothetical protein
MNEKEDLIFRARKMICYCDEIRGFLKEVSNKEKNIRANVKHLGLGDVPHLGGKTFEEFADLCNQIKWVACGELMEVFLEDDPSLKKKETIAGVELVRAMRREIENA